MSELIHKSSRRDFIRLCGSGTAVLCAGLLPSTSFALDGSVLPSRVNAAPLLLNYNENSLGMSPNAVIAASNATKNSGNRYPDGAVEELRATLASLNGVRPQEVILGNGSTEVIQAVVTMAEGLGAKVIEPTPTFGDVRRYSRR